MSNMKSKLNETEYYGHWLAIRQNIIAFEFIGKFK